MGERRRGVRRAIGRRRPRRKRQWKRATEVSAARRKRARDQVESARRQRAEICTKITKKNSCQFKLNFNFLNNKSGGERHGTTESERIRVAAAVAVRAGEHAAAPRRRCRAAGRCDWQPGSDE